jgi:flagellar assembly protein FliH
MDALIRAAQLAPVRTRLSESRVTDAPEGVTRAEQRGGSRSTHEALRADVENQVRAELTRELQQLYESERERARADGYAEGLTAAQSAAASARESAEKQLKARMDGALQALERAHQAHLEKLEASVGEVAFAALCRLIGEKAASAVFVLQLVEHACEPLRADTTAIARLHPRDIKLLNELLHGEEIRLRSLGFKLVPDESLELGGCVIEAASGRYEGGLESQLRRLHAVLTGATISERDAPLPVAGHRVQAVEG